MSTFAPELREAVREAADEAGLSLTEWMSQAAEAKIRADGQARILEEAERKRRSEALREAWMSIRPSTGPAPRRRWPAPAAGASWLKSGDASREARHERADSRRWRADRGRSW